MSDMSNLYRAYSAVHNKEIKEELTQNRDQISEMNLGKMVQADLVEVCEEIVEGLFQYGLGLDEACDVVASVLEESVSGERNELRDSKITQIAEAFESVFDTVTDKAERNCEEEFLQYRSQKPLTEKWNGRVSHETGNAKIHASIIHEDREFVKSGLIEMISKSLEEKKLDPVGKEDSDVDNDGDVDSSDKYLKKRREAIGKAMGKKKDVKEGMHRDAKTGEVVDKAEVGKTYYPNQPKKKTSVTKKPDPFGGRFKKEELDRIQEIVNSWED